MESLPVAFLLIYNAAILFGALRRGDSQRQVAPLLLLFFCSGMPALIYQIVWQRALFAIYGVNSESVAVVVGAFMIGLGLGSLFGGWLSTRYRDQAILFFALAELGTAIFGLVSLRIFHWAAVHTAGAPLAYVVPLSLVLLLFPTMCMGSTLPLLTDYMVREFFPVGYSVGVLYFVNTFGSAAACYLCATFLLRDFGQTGSVQIAALMNFGVGLAAMSLSRGKVKLQRTSLEATDDSKPLMSLRFATFISGLIAFISLGLEIIWFRVFALASSDRAPAFALLLTTFLAGIAAGGFVAGRLSEKTKNTRVVLGLGAALLLAGCVSPLLPPVVASLRWKGLNFLIAAPGFFLVAALMGAAFPLLCKLSLPAEGKLGQGVSLIYVSNIMGAAFGSLMVGFVMMNYFGTQTVALVLGISSAIAGGIVLWSVRTRVALARSSVTMALTGCVVVFLVTPILYSDFQRRLNLTDDANSAERLAHVVENRNGVIVVLRNGAVYGSGVYDGFFSVDPVNDKNLIVRAFAIAAFHPAPKRILMIGLSSGSWAQVLANHPQAEWLEIVEINPGYLKLIPQYAMVQSVLENPRVRLHIDDGRRWLLSHPEKRYDLIVQNTSFFWRDHSAELLSSDYLEIIRKHLNSGGVYYYNTTGSDDVVATGLSVFPYGLRVLNFLALSDRPINVDREAMVSVLRMYEIDGKPVFPNGRTETDTVLDRYRSLCDSLSGSQVTYGMENEQSMRRRLKNSLIFTDDNMGWEWR